MYLILIDGEPAARASTLAEARTLAKMSVGLGPTDELPCDCGVAIRPVGGII